MGFLFFLIVAGKKVRTDLHWKWNFFSLLSCVSVFTWWKFFLRKKRKSIQKKKLRSCYSKFLIFFSILSDGRRRQEVLFKNNSHAEAKNQAPSFLLLLMTASCFVICFTIPHLFGAEFLMLYLMQWPVGKKWVWQGFLTMTKCLDLVVRKDMVLLWNVKLFLKNNWKERKIGRKNHFKRRKGLL